MTVSVSGVDLPGDCLWLPHFNIGDFWSSIGVGGTSTF